MLVGGIDRYGTNSVIELQMLCCSYHVYGIPSIAGVGGVE